MIVAIVMGVDRDGAELSRSHIKLNLPERYSKHGLLVSVASIRIVKVLSETEKMGCD